MTLEELEVMALLGERACLALERIALASERTADGLEAFAVATTNGTRQMLRRIDVSQGMDPDSEGADVVELGIVRDADECTYPPASDGCDGDVTR